MAEGIRALLLLLFFLSLFGLRLDGVQNSIHCSLEGERACILSLIE